MGWWYDRLDEGSGCVAKEQSAKEQRTTQPHQPVVPQDTKPQRRKRKKTREKWPLSVSSFFLWRPLPPFLQIEIYYGLSFHYLALDCYSHNNLCSQKIIIIEVFNFGYWSKGYYEAPKDRNKILHIEMDFRIIR